MGVGVVSCVFLEEGSLVLRQIKKRKACMGGGLTPGPWPQEEVRGKIVSGLFAGTFRRLC